MQKYCNRYAKQSMLIIYLISLILSLIFERINEAFEGKYIQVFNRKI